MRHLHSRIGDCHGCVKGSEHIDKSFTSVDLHMCKYMQVCVNATRLKLAKGNGSDAKIYTECDLALALVGDFFIKVYI